MKKLSLIGMILVLLLNCACYAGKKDASAKEQDDTETVTITKEMVSDDMSNNRYYPVMSRSILGAESNSTLKYVIRQLASLTDYELYEMIEATQSQGETYAVRQKIMECVTESTDLDCEGVLMYNFSSDQIKSMVALSLTDGDFDASEELQNSLPDLSYVDDSSIPGYYWHFINGMQIGMKSNGVNAEVILIPYEIFGSCKFLLFLVPLK